MTISKLNMPEDVVLSHNPIPVVVETDKYRTTLGTKQVLKLFFTANTTNGKKIIISWKDFDMELVFATTPDDTGLQLPLYNGAISSGYDTLLAALKTNYYLDRYYSISLSTSLVSGYYQGTITLTQRSFGQIWAATAIDGDDPSSYTPSILTAQVMPAYGANFRFLCDIYHQVSPSSARSYTGFITQLDASGDDANTAKFNLSEVFKNWKTLKPDFPYTISFETCPNVLANYYLVLSESYGSVEQAKNTVTEPATLGANLYNQVILGGLPFLEYPGNSFIADYIDATYVKFLTRKQSGKHYVCKQMPHWLYWYNKSDQTDLELKVTLYMDDGTNTTVTKTTFSGTAGQKKIYSVAVGYNDLDLDSDLTALTDVEKYEVWVENGAGTRLTEKFVFMVDTRYNEYNNYLFVHNSLGGVDTIWLSGDCLIQPESFGTELEYAVAVDYEEGNIEAANSKLRYSYKFNSGWKFNITEIEVFKELLRSNDVRWIPDSKIRPGYPLEEPFTSIKMVIDKGSIEEWPNDVDSMYALSFIGKEGHYEW